MPEQVVNTLEMVVQILEIIGAGALVVGFIVATVGCLRQVVTLGAPVAYSRYRKALARVVLIGLEVLVAATIIKTITVAPTLESLGLLGIMVAIRTILGWSVVLEMSGRWPWQKTPATPGDRSTT